MKKAVKQEKTKSDPSAPAAAPEGRVPKENGSANVVPQTNGHSSPQPEASSADPSGKFECRSLAGPLASDHDFEGN